MPYLYSRFFYGIYYSQEELRPLKQMLQAVWEISGYRGSGTDMEELDSIGARWYKQGDPICLYREPSGKFWCLCIRKSLNIASTDEYITVTPFDIAPLDVRAWNLALETQCKRFQLPYTRPFFQLIATTYLEYSEKYDGMVGVGYCFYGIELGEAEELQADIVRELESSTGIVRRLKNSAAALLRVENLIYLGIRASYMRVQVLPEESIHWRRMRVPKPTVWAELIKAKCKKYGLDCKHPEFYLSIHMQFF